MHEVRCSEEIFKKNFQRVYEHKDLHKNSGMKMQIKIWPDRQQFQRFLRLLNSLLRKPSGTGKEIGTVFGRVAFITPESNDSILFLLFY